MNKALPVEKLRGAVFAEPISSKYHTISNNISEWDFIRLLSLFITLVRLKIINRLANMDLTALLQYINIYQIYFEIQKKEFLEEDIITQIFKLYSFSISQ